MTVIKILLFRYVLDVCLSTKHTNKLLIIHESRSTQTKNINNIIFTMNLNVSEMLSDVLWYFAHISIIILINSRIVFGLSIYYFHALKYTCSSLTTEGMKTKAAWH